jgi:hypothetical protein
MSGKRAYTIVTYSRRSDWNGAYERHESFPIFGYREALKEAKCEAAKPWNTAPVEIWRLPIGLGRKLLVRWVDPPKRK